MNVCVYYKELNNYFTFCNFRMQEEANLMIKEADLDRDGKVNYKGKCM